MSFSKQQFEATMEFLNHQLAKKKVLKLDQLQNISYLLGLKYTKKVTEQF